MLSELLNPRVSSQSLLRPNSIPVCLPLHGPLLVLLQPFSLAFLICFLHVPVLSVLFKCKLFSKFSNQSSFLGYKQLLNLITHTDPSLEANTQLQRYLSRKICKHFRLSTSKVEPVLSRRMLQLAPGLETLALVS